MTDKRFTIKEIDNFNYGIQVTDVILDKNIELPQSTVCDLLNELNGYKEKVEKLLQSEFKKRTEEMEYWAKKDDWNTFSAIQVERGTIQLIAKELGVELE